MKCTYYWLKEFVDFDFTPTELADRLTMLGLEVDSYETVRRNLAGAIVAELLEKEGTSWQVSLGKEKVSATGSFETLQPGQRVVVMPAEGGSGYQIATYQQLHISEDESPAFVGNFYKPGEKLSAIIPEEDTLYDIDLTPNRADCLSIIGIAREISAITGNPLHLPEIRLQESDTPATEYVKVTIETPDGCPRYAARVVRNVTVQPSPIWMHDRLAKVGVRAINNIVDVTNYVMIETGHPLHAFDYALISKGQIVVRLSRPGERFVTLDGKAHTLDDQTVLICDGVRPVAIGGIMGGLNSEVRQNTRDLLLECAYFDPRYIRRSASRLGISTESSLRFSRGVDPNDTPMAIDRTAQLIQMLSGGEVLKGIVDEYVKPVEPVYVTLRRSRVTRVLGADVDGKNIEGILQRLGCRIRVEGTRGKPEAAETLFEVLVPTFRPDLTREIDLIEEIVRVLGYDEIPAKLDTTFRLDETVNRKERFLNGVRHYFVGNGFYEAVSNSMIPLADMSLAAYPGETLQLVNPLSEDMAVLRPSLIPSLMRMGQYNLFRQQEDIRLFEIGTVFIKTEEGHREELHLGGILVGHATPDHWKHKSREADFFDLKGLVDGFLHRFQLPEIKYNEEGHWALEEPAIAVKANGQNIGFLGAVQKKLQELYDFPLSCYIFELNLSDFLPIIKWEKHLKPIPRFQWVKSDLAFVVDLEIPGGTLVEEIKKWGGTILREVNIFDVYMGKQVPTGKKSVAVSLIFQADDRTLTEEEINETVERIIAEVKNKLGADLRA